jgi:aminoglycoside N3'-acetyltransferase
MADLTPHRTESIAADLRDLGLAAGDVVMVHASLRAVGPVEDGALGLLDAIGSVIGPDGTILVNVGVRDDHGWVNDRPEAERPALLADAEPFDALVTPADPDNGVLAEIFRTRPGTLVSDHPEGRFGASGRLAAAFTVDVPWDDYYGTGSPLERFTDAGGKVLRLGADPDTVTLIHLAEHLVALPDKRRVRRHRLVTGADGPEIRVVDTLDDADGIADYDTGAEDVAGAQDEDEFTTILRAYLDTGRASIGAVGGATSELLDGPDLVGFAVGWMAEHARRP